MISCWALDLWMLKGLIDLHSEYTHKNYYSRVTSIIDYAAINADHFFSANIESLHDFVGGTDHHFIKVSIILDNV